MTNLILDKYCLNNVSLVIFDKDGTLFDLHKYWSFIVIERAKYFSRMLPGVDYDYVYSELLLSMGLCKNNQISNKGPIGVKTRDFIIDLVYKVISGIDPNVDIKDINKGFLFVDSLIEDNFKSIIKKLPGVDDLLQSIKNSGCLIALATSDTSVRALKTLEYSGISSYFDCIVGSDNVANAKPDSEIIDKILTYLDIYNRDSVVLIGDSDSDLYTAINSRINFVGTMTGSSSNEFIKNTELLIHDLSEITVERRHV